MGVTPDFAGWTPVRIDNTGPQASVDWCFTDGYEFDDPFFDQTVQRCLREPARLLFRRRTALHLVADEICPDPSPPTGVVAHISRCGSTLVTQLLSTRGDTTAWSEPPVIDTVVRAAAAGACRVEDVRALLGVFAARGRPYSAIKLDAWTTLDLPIVRAALPRTPVVVLIRDPLEVLVSQAGHRGYHMIPGTLPPQLLRLRPEQLPGIDLDDYGAIVLGRLLEAAYAFVQADANALVFDYTDLPVAVQKMTRGFGLETAPDQARRLQQTALLDAKNPVLPFTDDRARKQRAATDRMRRAIDRWARPWYERLLHLRSRQP